MKYRTVASLTSWFFQPQFGMKGYEVLSRASCFAMTSSNGQMLHIIGAHHVTHPFRYPNYYPPDQFEWLKHVNMDHIKLTLELRHPTTGEALLEYPLARDPHLIHGHPDLDLVAVHPEGTGADFMEILASQGFLLDPLLVAHDDSLTKTLKSPEASEKGTPLTFHGHRLEPRTDKATGDDISLLHPEVVHGTSLGGESPRFLASTDSVLEMGMCGGPVLDEQGLLVGVVEGIVPESVQQLAGAAVCIDARTVESFLETVSADIAHHERVATGREALGQGAGGEQESRGKSATSMFRSMSGVEEQSASAFASHFGHQPINRSAAPNVADEDVPEELLNLPPEILLAAVNDPQSFIDAAKQTGADDAMARHLLEQAQAAARKKARRETQEGKRGGRRSRGGGKEGRDYRARLLERLSGQDPER